MYFLCGKCEERLSVWETAFKREFYESYHAGSLNSVQYGPWLLKFATSLLWRVLRAASETVDATPPEIKRAASPAEKTWCDFLLDKREHPGPFCQYLFFLIPVPAGTPLRAMRIRSLFLGQRQRTVQVSNLASASLSASYHAS